MRVAGCALFVQASSTRPAGGRAEQHSCREGGPAGVVSAPAAQGLTRVQAAVSAASQAEALQGKGCCTVSGCNHGCISCCPSVPRTGLRPHRDVRRHLCELPRHPGEGPSALGSQQANHTLACALVGIHELMVHACDE